MKTWKMIKELTENGQEQTFYANNEAGYSCTAYMDGQSNIRIDTGSWQLKADTDWQEVKQTVGWDKALEHMMNGGKTQLHFYTYFFSSNNWLMSSWEKPAPACGSVTDYSHLTEAMIKSKEWELL